MRTHLIIGGNPDCPELDYVLDVAKAFEFKVVGAGGETIVIKVEEKDGRLTLYTSGDGNSRHVLIEGQGDIDRPGMALRMATALTMITQDENGKIAKGTMLEGDCPHCLRKRRMARTGLNGGAS